MILPRGKLATTAVGTRLLVLFLAAMPMATVRAESSGSPHTGALNPPTGAPPAVALTMFRGMELSVTTRSGETIDGRYHHKTADSLYLFVDGQSGARRVAYDSVTQVSVYGTGSVDRSTLLGVIGFAFGYAMGYLIDHSHAADSTENRRMVIGLGCAGLGILTGATFRTRRARMSADAFWGLPDCPADNAESHAAIRFQLSLTF